MTSDPAPGEQTTGGSGLYDAFLSYSHSDGEVAAAVQNGLHRVGRRMGQLRALRVYRDATDLAANPSFWSKLVDAIDSARFFIVILSPAAARSEWVDREITHWLEGHGSDNVLLVLATGTLVWEPKSGRFDPGRSSALPASLSRPEIFVDEPLYVDLSSLGKADLDDLRQGDFRSKIVDLAAPVHGKPKEVLESEDRRELRSFQRYRRFAISALVVLTVVSVLATGLAWSQRNEARSQSRATRGRELAALALTEEDPDRAMVLAIEAELATSTPSTAARSAFAAVSARYGRLPAHALGPGLDQHNENVLDIDLSPDGRWLATVGADGSLLVWDPVDGSNPLPPNTLTTPGFKALAAGWSPDGQMLAAGGRDGKILLWRNVADEPVAVLDAEDGADVSVLAWSGDSSMLATGDPGGGVIVWTRDDWEPTILLARLGGEPDDGYRQDLDWEPDGPRLIASGVEPSTAVVLDVDHPGSVVDVWVEFGSVRAVAWAPDGSFVAAAGTDGTISAQDPLTGDFMWAFDFRGDWVDDIAFSPDASKLVSGGHDSQVRVFDVATGQQIGEGLTSHRGWLNAVEWSSDGATLVTASMDRTVRVWNAAPSAAPLELDTGNEVYDIDWSPNGSRLVASDADGRVVVWEADGTTEALTMDGHVGIAGAVQWSPDGRLLATGGDDGLIKIWDMASGQPTRTIDAHDHPVLGLAWSPGSDYVVSASLDETVRVWSVTGGQEVALLGNAGDYSSVSWSPDGTLVAAAGPGDAVSIWSVPTWDPLTALPGPGTHVVESVVWSPDGELLAAGYSDGLIRLWDPAESSLRSVLAGHNGEVLDLDWSPTGELLASASSDASLILWDVAAGAPLGQPLTHPEWKADVVAVAWSHDGRGIASAFNIGTAQLWEAVTEPEACQRSVRALGDEGLRSVIGGSAPPACLRPDDVAAFSELPTSYRRSVG